MTTSILLGQNEGLAPILGNCGIAGIGRGEPEADRAVREEDSGEAGGDLGRGEEWLQRKARVMT